MLPNSSVAGSTVRPADTTRSSAPGIWLPTGSSSWNRARDRARSPSQCEPRCQPSVIGPLHTDSTAGTARFCGAGVADEQQLRVEFQVPQRDGRLEPVDSHCAEADLRASRSHQRHHVIDGLATDGVDADDGPARVVAVKAPARIRVQLGSRPRPEHGPELRSHEIVRPVTRVQWIVRDDGKLVRVRAQPHGCSQRSRPLDLGVREDAGHRLIDLVFASRREPLPRHGAVQGHWIEPVTPQLHADRALGMTLEEVTQPPKGEAATHRRPPFRLLELIAVLGVVEKVREVRKEIQAVVEREARRADGPRPRRSRVPVTTTSALSDAACRRMAASSALDDVPGPRGRHRDLVTVSASRSLYGRSRCLD